MSQLKKSEPQRSKQTKRKLAPDLDYKYLDPVVSWELLVHSQQLSNQQLYSVLYICIITMPLRPIKKYLADGNTFRHVAINMMTCLHVPRL